MKTRHCDECKHFNDEDIPGAKVCEKNHKPRFYLPRSVMDMNCGYKRKCADFEEIKWAYSATRNSAS